VCHQIAHCPYISIYVDPYFTERQSSESYFHNWNMVSRCYSWNNFFWCGPCHNVREKNLS
jgi:hypothetical protein